MGKWENRFAGYVIRKVTDRYFVAERCFVACRSDAARFSQKSAMAFIDKQKNPDDYVIEDAT